MKAMPLTPGNRKPHAFQVIKSKSWEKGSFKKNPSGLIQVATDSKFVYECKRCNSIIEFDSKIDPRTLNEQIADKFGCK